MNSQKLLVEGADDLHVVKTLCIRFEMPHVFRVVDCKGIDPLLNRLPVDLKESGLKTLGILVDADHHLERRWQSLRDILQSVFAKLPDQLPKYGLIIPNTNGVRLGVWIMPNNEEKGMLEDFLRFLIPTADRLLPKVDLFLQDIEDCELQNYSLNHKAKVRIHSWLALQEDPGTPLGAAITKRYLTIDDPVVVQFMKWIADLYITDPQTLSIE